MTSPWHAHFESLTKQVTSPPVVAAGKLVRGIGLTLEAVGCQLPVGSQCLVQTIEGEINQEPEVQLLERQLQKAIDKEEYEMAARIRDKIKEIDT